MKDLFTCSCTISHKYALFFCSELDLGRQFQVIHGHPQLCLHKRGSDPHSRVVDGHSGHAARYGNLIRSNLVKMCISSILVKMSLMEYT